MIQAMRSTTAQAAMRLRHAAKILAMPPLSLTRQFHLQDPCQSTRQISSLCVTALPRARVRVRVSCTRKKSGLLLSSSSCSTSTSATASITSALVLRSFSSATPSTYPANTEEEEEKIWLSVLKEDEKVVAPPLVYIAGEEMTRYACQRMLDAWIHPFFDTIPHWQYFDLSCQARDVSNDLVLRDAVQAGKRVGAIFKEPTITPSAQQVKDFGLSQSLCSPNGAMRRGWNGITISRDTIHIDGIQLGYQRPVFFERHAVGGEYAAGWASVGQGTLLTTFLPKNKNQEKENAPPFVVDTRELTDEHNVVVCYSNPYDNVEPLAHLFFTRCLEAHITPYVVTKKTVFKWQEGFWNTMKSVFDAHYHDQFLKAGLLDKCHGQLSHLISDAATMQLIRWTEGGFGMAAHNYDGDMLTDQIAQVHRSPGFITSNLVGKHDVDGTLIKEFEASHGTVSDLWHDHLAGKETSLNPLGLVEAMMGALDHAAHLSVERAATPDLPSKRKVQAQVRNFNTTLRKALHNTFRYGQGTRDMCGPSGYTTEDFIDKVAWRLKRYLAAQYEESPPPILREEPDRKYRRNYDIDEEQVAKLFAQYDKNGDGHIDFQEFTRMLVKMNLAPLKEQQALAKAKSPDI